LVPLILYNGMQFDAIPSRLARAKRSSHARQLALSHWLLRRKEDSRYLATIDAQGRVQALQSMGNEQKRALQRFASDVYAGRRGSVTLLPLTGLEQRLRQLGLSPETYAEVTGLALVPEPSQLTLAGRDRFRRPLWLASGAARAWQQMQSAARRDAVLLEAISGYRGHDYQLGIFQRKLARGLSIDEILQVNAAPGYSEHHSGCALDISSLGEPAAEESFENSAAFDWLMTHAEQFGFRLSYPRDNPHGIVYEPWHWYYVR
jgi:D-alanyl-D-alanine carboxypeptidase